MNHCVVYRHIGGHAYGATYPGPMGSVLTPVLEGLARSHDLPHACTLNGKCQDVCPVMIPLPKLLRGWRDRSWREGLEPVAMRSGLRLWGFVAERPAFYRLAVSTIMRLARLFDRGGWIRHLPFATGWTAHRDLPTPAARGFMAQYRDRLKGTGR
jgi:L-lactate dehydrogenase complex protein LldF